MCMIKFEEVKVKTPRREVLVNITSEINNIVRDSTINEGVCRIFVPHTTAGVTINENADPSVTDDFETFMSHLIPDGSQLYTHILEGNDDMPAHIKSALFGQSLSIPITNHKLNLGTWQGIYLCEFRNFGGNRKIVATIFS